MFLILLSTLGVSENNVPHVLVEVCVVQGAEAVKMVALSFHKQNGHLRSDNE